MSQSNHSFQDQSKDPRQWQPFPEHGSSRPPADLTAHTLSNQAYSHNYPNQAGAHLDTPYNRYQFPLSQTHGMQHATGVIANAPSSTGMTPVDFASHSSFQPLNAPPRTLAPATMSPSRMSYGTDTTSPGYEDSSNFSTHSQPTPTKLRHDSLNTKEQDSSSRQSNTPVGRRRKSEYAEPGSARAIYLEKNRKAASKCRNKQKQEQEMLVESSREHERRNRLLKSEKAMLLEEIRGIKEMLAQHANCPDQRIAAYLQLQADRLAHYSTPSNMTFPDSTRTSFEDSVSPTTAYFPQP